MLPRACDRNFIVHSETQKLIAQMQAGDKRALARLMTYVDNRHDDLLDVMVQVSPSLGRAYRLGVTGPPGAGKSTLVDKLITEFRNQQKTVAVVAVDPSSPFSGGAVLGDRIRMQDHNADDGVFIRSLGSHGAHGGVSRATNDIVGLFDAFGFDVVIVETVGVGQTELDIMAIAQTTLVVLVPESGDTIQTMKAGLMEIADIFVVNKADREGADRIFHELKSLTHMSSAHDRAQWEVPVLKTVATKREGIMEVMTSLAAHREFVDAQQTLRAQVVARLHEQRCLEIVLSEIENILKQRVNWDDLKRSSPYEAAQEILKKIRF